MTYTAFDLVDIKRNTPITTSLKVAEVFEKQHKNLIRDIEKILADSAEMASESQSSNLSAAPMFTKATYQAEEGGRSYPMYYLTRDGLALLAMGFTGKKALKFKLAYIQAFNYMEGVIKNWGDANWCDMRAAVKKQFRVLTDAIKECVIPIARRNGSKTPDDKFYMTYSKLLCTAACYNPRGRDKLTSTHLRALEQMEDIAAANIRLVAEDPNADHHDIYAATKQRLYDYADITLIRERFAPKLLAN